MTAHPGRPLPPSRFAGDDGEPDGSLAAAIEAYAAGAGRGQVAPVLAALGAARVLVPVVAVLDEVAALGGETGGTGGQPKIDKASHMAAVSTTGRDGRRGLLAFTGLAALRRWDPAARPVPVLGAEAAQAALAGGDHALVLDIAGPVMVAVEGQALAELAGRVSAAPDR